MSVRTFAIAAFSFVCFLFDACGKGAAEVRPFHIINLSFPRTGTTSLAGIFSKYPATHEFKRSETIIALLDWREKKITDTQLIEFLHDRDRQAGHFLDSAAFFFLAPEMVIRAFPGAGYFFSIRDCESWIVSLIDMEIIVMDRVRKGINTTSLAYHDRYGRLFSPRFRRSAFFDRSRLAREVSPMLEDIARFWSSFTISTLEQMLKLPRRQRLIIHLKDFDASAAKIALLAGIHTEDLNLRNIHLNKDISATEIRKLFGAQRLAEIAAPHQKRVDDWLAAHRSEIDP